LLFSSKDVPTLSKCIPSFYDLFMSPAIFNAVAPLSDAEENQHAFMQDAIVAYAKEYSGPGMDTLDLGEISTLADLWDFDENMINTLFLLSMYEFGRDRVVDELLTKCGPLINVQYFCKDGVSLACRRLNDLLHINPTDEMRNVMSLLDADLCEWIRERAEADDPLVIDGNLKVPVSNTHLFALRLLSLAAGADISKEERIKIHSLIVLSGTVVKATEAPKTASKPQLKKAVEAPNTETSETVTVQESAPEASETIMSQESVLETSETIMSQESAPEASETIMSQESVLETSETIMSQESAPETSETIMSQESAPEASETIMSQESAPETSETIMSQESAPAASETIMSQESALETSKTIMSQESAPETSETISQESAPEPIVTTVEPFPESALDTSYMEES
jgi:hypothetical protein